MPRRYYSSIAQRTTLAADINSSTTSVTVAAVTGWPSSFPYTLIIDQDTISEEIVEVTARSGTTLTVTRGVDGTTAVAHTAGATVNHGVSARDFNEPNQFLNEGGTVAGPTLVTANSASNALEVRQVGAGNALVVEDSTNPDSSPIVVNADGQFIVGDTTIRTINSATNHAVQIGGAAARVTVTRYDNGANSSALWLNKSRSATPGSFVTVQNGDGVGCIYFHADDGTDLNNRVAAIEAFVDGAPGTNDTPGRLVFSTTADGSDTTTERMRITNAGLVGIGTSSPDTSARVTIAGTESIAAQRWSNDAFSPRITFQKSRSTTVGTLGTVVQSGDEIGGLIFRADDGAALRSAAAIAANVDGTPGSSDMPGRLTFFTTPDGSSTLTERMRITSAGSVGIGNTTPSKLVHLGGGTNADMRIGFNSATGAALIGVNTSNDVEIMQQLANNLVLGTSNIERMRIDSSGNVGIGTSSPGEKLTVQDDSAAIVSARGNAYVATQLFRFSTDAQAPYLLFVKARGTRTSPAVVTDADTIGALQFLAYDGGANREVATIMASVDGGAGASDVPSRLQFYTTPDGGISNTERMRINNAGLITGTGTSLGAWTTYTPTLGGTGWALGDGTLSFYYCQVGKIIHVRGFFQFGSTSTAGAGGLTLTLPVSASTTGTNRPTFACFMFDTSATALYTGNGVIATTFQPKTIGTGGLTAGVTTNAPMTWASGDQLYFSSTYEAA